MKKNKKILYTGILIQLVLYNSYHLVWPTTFSQEAHQESIQNIPTRLLHVISVDMVKVPFEKALSIIAQKGKFKLNYNRSRLPVQKKITLKMANTPAIQVLQKILKKTGTQLKINREGYLLVIPKINKPKKYGIVAGKASEQFNYRNIPGALLTSSPFKT